MKSVNIILILFIFLESILPILSKIDPSDLVNHVQLFGKLDQNFINLHSVFHFIDKLLVTSYVILCYKLYCFTESLSIAEAAFQKCSLK